MIDTVVETLRQEANDYLANHFGPAMVERPVGHVTLSRIVKDDGALDLPSELAMAIVKVDQDRMFPNSRRIRRDGDDNVYATPEAGLILHLLVAAKPVDPLKDTLRNLAALVTWAHARPLYTSEHVEALAEAAIDRITIEIETVDYEVQNHIWGTLGSKYLPSVLLLVRCTPIRPADIDRVGSPIKEIGDVMP